MSPLYIGNAWKNADAAVMLSEPVAGFLPNHKVSIHQSHGSLSFTHVMTTDQAREMAAALLAMADEADKRDGVAR